MYETRTQTYMFSLQNLNCSLANPNYLTFTALKNSGFASIIEKPVNGVAIWPYLTPLYPGRVSGCFTMNFG